MKAILLDGSQETGGTGERVRAALAAQLQAQGWDMEHIVLREKRAAPAPPISSAGFAVPAHAM